MTMLCVLRVHDIALAQVDIYGAVLRACLQHMLAQTSLNDHAVRAEHPRLALTQVHMRVQCVCVLCKSTACAQSGRHGVHGLQVHSMCSACVCVGCKSAACVCPVVFAQFDPRPVQTLCCSCHE